MRALMKFCPMILWQQRGESADYQTCDGVLREKKAQCGNQNVKKNITVDCTYFSPRHEAIKNISPVALLCCCNGGFICGQFRDL